MALEIHHPCNTNMNQMTISMLTKSPLKKPAAHHASSTGAAQSANLSSWLYEESYGRTDGASRSEMTRCRGGESRHVCKHIGALGMFRWLMTSIIVTNEFVQLNEILLLIWSYVKEAPQFHYSKRRSRYSTQIYISRLRIFLVLSVVRLRRTLRLV